MEVHQAPVAVQKTSDDIHDHFHVSRIPLLSHGITSVHHARHDLSVLARMSVVGLLLDRSCHGLVSRATLSFHISFLEVETERASIAQH